MHLKAFKIEIHDKCNFERKKVQTQTHAWIHGFGIISGNCNYSHQVCHDWICVEIFPFPAFSFCLRVFLIFLYPENIICGGWNWNTHLNDWFSCPRVARNYIVLSTFSFRYTRRYDCSMPDISHIPPQAYHAEMSVQNVASASFLN